MRNVFCRLTCADKSGLFIPAMVRATGWRPEARPSIIIEIPRNRRDFHDRGSMGSEGIPKIQTPGFTASWCVVSAWFSWKLLFVFVVVILWKKQLILCYNLDTLQCGFRIAFSIIEGSIYRIDFVIINTTIKCDVIEKTRLFRERS